MMKKLAIFMICGLVILGATASYSQMYPERQATSKQTPKGRSFFLLRGGYFSPSDSDVDEIWDGGGITISAGIGGKSPESQFSTLLAIDYWKKETTLVAYDYYYHPTYIDFSLRIIPITFSVIYNIPNEGGFTPYFGGGFGYYMAKLEAKASGYSESESESSWGFHLLGGLEFPVSPNTSINVEAKYASAEIDDWDMQAGGLTVCGGLAFSY
ncbi:MAG: OmpW family outer membrane protein [bacterium]